MCFYLRSFTCNNPKNKMFSCPKMKWDNENVCNQYTNLIAEKAELLPNVNSGCVHNKTAAQDVINRMSKDLKETIQSLSLSLCTRPRDNNGGN